MDLANTRKCFLCVATVLSTLQVLFKPASLLTSELSCPSLYRWSSYWAEQLLVLAWDGHNLSAGSLAPCLVCNHCCLTPVLTCRTQNPWGSTQHCKPSYHSSQGPATVYLKTGKQWVSSESLMHILALCSANSKIPNSVGHSRVTSGAGARHPAVNCHRVLTWVFPGNPQPRRSPYTTGLQIIEAERATGTSILFLHTPIQQPGLEDSDKPTVHCCSRGSQDLGTSNVAWRGRCRYFCSW